MTPFAVAVGVFGGVAALVLAFIPYRKHRLALLDSLDDTIRSIESGRLSQVAIAEDYPTHKNLINDLRPYRILDIGFTRACKSYNDLYEKIYKQEASLTFMVNPEATKVILEHLNILKVKV